MRYREKAAFIPFPKATLIRGGALLSPYARLVSSLDRKMCLGRLARLRWTCSPTSSPLACALLQRAGTTESKLFMESAYERGKHRGKASEAGKPRTLINGALCFCKKKTGNHFDTAFNIPRVLDFSETTHKHVHTHTVKRLRGKTLSPKQPPEISLIGVPFIDHFESVVRVGSVGGAGWKRARTRRRAGVENIYCTDYLMRNTKAGTNALLSCSGEDGVLLCF